VFAKFRGRILSANPQPPTLKGTKMSKFTLIQFRNAWKDAGSPKEVADILSKSTGETISVSTVNAVAGTLRKKGFPLPSFRPPRVVPDIEDSDLDELFAVEAESTGKTVDELKADGEQSLKDTAERVVIRKATREENDKLWAAEMKKTGKTKKELQAEGVTTGKLRAE